jgi:hypothetical protein
VFRFGQRIFYPLKFFAAAVTGGGKFELIVILPAVTTATTTLSAKHYGSIFGTAISQARNDFDDDELRRCILSNTISTSYGTQKMVGTEGA